MSFIDPNDNGIISRPFRKCMERKDGKTPEGVTIMENGDWVETKNLHKYEKWIAQQQSATSQ